MDEIFTGKWYPWYAAKALESEDFADLSLTEEGAYRRALDIAWKKGSLPADPAKFAAVVGKRCTEKVAVKILRLFIPMPEHPSRVINGTLERIRKEQEEKHRRRVGAGKQGGRPTKPNENGDEKSIAKALLNQCLSNAPTDLDREEESKKEEEKKREEVAEAAPKRQKGTRLPDQFFITSDMRAYGREKRPDVDLSLETEKFCNHFRAQPGQKGVKLNWELTWKNWILNARSNGNGTHRQNSDRPTTADRLRGQQQNVLSKYKSETEC